MHRDVEKYKNYRKLRVILLIHNKDGRTTLRLVSSRKTSSLQPLQSAERGPVSRLFKSGCMLGTHTTLG